MWLFFQLFFLALLPCEAVPGKVGHGTFFQQVTVLFLRREASAVPCRGRTRCVLSALCLARAKHLLAVLHGSGKRNGPPLAASACKQWEMYYSRTICNEAWLEGGA